MTDRWVPGLIDCTFAARIRRDDAEEFAECFGALVEQFGEDGMHARFRVHPGQEETFMEYCVDDVMVKSSGRVRSE
jgi:hypothetical protein